MNKTQYTDEYMIEKYIELCNKLVRVASKRDINNCEELPHSWTITHRFGTMENLHKIAGVIKNNETSGKPFKSEIEKLLIKKRIYKGRRLDYMEIRVDLELPSIEYIRKVYDDKNLDQIWNEVEKAIPRGIADYLGV